MTAVGSGFLAWRDPIYVPALPIGLVTRRAGGLLLAVGDLSPSSWIKDQQGGPIPYQQAMAVGRSSRLAQQGPKASLLKVVVAGQGIGEPAIGHHDERDAIAEAPRFVGAFHI